MIALIGSTWALGAVLLGVFWSGFAVGSLFTGEQAERRHAERLNRIESAWQAWRKEHGV